MFKMAGLETILSIACLQVLWAKGKQEIVLDPGDPVFGEAKLLQGHPNSEICRQIEEMPGQNPFRMEFRAQQRALQQHNKAI